MSGKPILWSFRRCPYAMRARHALVHCGQAVEIREILLSNKPMAFLDKAPDKTVPVLELIDGSILHESRDIIFWACSQSDIGQKLNAEFAREQAENSAFLDRLEGDFKHHLDRYKYSTRYTENPEIAAQLRLENRQKASIFINEIEQRISAQPFLCGQSIGILDIATLPFIRQFRIADIPWFDAQEWHQVHHWLANFMGSEIFAQIMVKYPPWQEEDAPTMLA